MIEKINAILSALQALPGNIVDFFTDPIWGVGATAALVIIGCIVGGWFFQKLRPMFGAGAIGAILSVIFFRKGQKAERARHEGEVDELKRRLEEQRQPNQNRWDWWNR